MNDDSIANPGAVFFPEAYGDTFVASALSVAAAPAFYRMYLRYVLAVAADIKQLVGFRANIVTEVARIVQGEGASNDDIAKITWCALAFATSRYFDEKAENHEWSPDVKAKLMSSWLSFLAAVFVPNEPPKLDVAKLKSWVKDFQIQQKQKSGPLRSCEMCASKCLYHWEASELTSDSSTRYKFNQAINNKGDQPASEAAANFCFKLTLETTGHNNIDLSFCLASHLLLNQPNTESPTIMPEDMIFVLARKIRNSLEEKTTT